MREDQAFPDFIDLPKRHSGSYITNIENVSNLLLDNGKKLPEWKYFLETHYDSDKRIFTGWVDWTEEPTFE